MKNTKLKKLWFHHDFNARNDPKLLEVNMEVGTHGIAIFWMVVEMLYENDGYLSERELKTLIFTFHLNKEDVNKVLEICFDKDSKGNITSKRVIEELQEMGEISKKMSDNSKKRWNKVREAPLPDWMDENGNVKEHKSEPMTEEQKEKCQKAMKDLFGDD